MNQVQASEKVFAITGATGVMLICYLIPVALHLMLRQQEFGQDKAMEASGDALTYRPYQVLFASWPQMLLQLALIYLSMSYPSDIREARQWLCILPKLRLILKC